MKIVPMNAAMKNSMTGSKRDGCLQLAVQVRLRDIGQPDHLIQFSAFRDRDHLVMEPENNSRQPAVGPELIAFTRSMELATASTRSVADRLRATLSLLIKGTPAPTECPACGKIEPCGRRAAHDGRLEDVRPFTSSLFRHQPVWISTIVNAKPLAIYKP